MTKTLPRTRALGWLLAALLLLIATPSISAHPGPDPLEHAVQVVATFLELSEEQIQALVTLRTVAQQVLEPVAAEIAVREAALQELVASADPNPAEIGVLVLSIRALRQQVEGVKAAAANEFAALLSAEQGERLHTVRSAAHLCQIVPAFGALFLL